MDISFPFLAQTLLLYLLYSPISFLSTFSHLLSSQKYGSTCRTLEKPISWLLSPTLLPLLLHPISSISLSLSLSLWSFPFFVFYLSFPSLLTFYLFFSSPFLSFVFTTLIFLALVSTTFHSLRYFIIFTSSVF